VGGKGTPLVDNTTLGVSAEAVEEDAEEETEGSEFKLAETYPKPLGLKFLL
jgi:hypothetical protein